MQWKVLGKLSSTHQNYLLVTILITAVERKSVKRSEIILYTTKVFIFELWQKFYYCSCLDILNLMAHILYSYWHCFRGLVLRDKLKTCVMWYQWVRMFRQDPSGVLMSSPKYRLIVFGSDGRICLYSFKEDARDDSMIGIYCIYE